MANRLPTSRWFLLGILWLSLLVLSVKLAVAWTTRSLSLGAAVLQTLVTQLSIILSFLVSLKPQDYRRFQVVGHGYRETLISLGLWSFLSGGGLFLGAIAISQLLGLTPPPIPPRITPLLWQCLGVVFISHLFLLVANIYQTKNKNQRFLGFTTICLLNDLWITALSIGCLTALTRGIYLPDNISTIFLVGVSLVNFWLVLHWQLPLLINQVAIAPEELAQIAHAVGGVTQCTRIYSKGIVGRSVYIEMTIIIHPEVMGYESVIAERIEAALKERYGMIAVRIQISNSTAT